MACVALHPQVAQLEADLGRKAQVLRVSIVTATGRELANELGVTEVPSFIVLDRDNHETWRGVSVPRVANVIDASQA
jgi:thiol-disulfide isomerase/thioredoxin